MRQLKILCLKIRKGDYIIDLIFDAISKMIAKLQELNNGYFFFFFDI